MINFNVQTGETTVEEVPDLNIETIMVQEPTPERRIAEMEAEIARLKSELNVQ